MLEHLITTIYVGFIFVYSYFVNVVICNNEIQHYTYFINKITKINILFVKFMQWFSSNNMRKEVKELIRSFADEVHYCDADIDYEQLTTLICNANAVNKKLTLNMTPINSGTIALVFEGTLDNVPIVVKQIRKNIKYELKKSIELMKFMAEISVYIPYLKLFRMNEIIKYNEEPLMGQIDFKREIANCRAFDRAFEDVDDIIIPKIYDEITGDNPNCIVMEKIIGKKAQNVRDEEVEEYCTTYNNLLVQSLIKRGILHADLHIGNIFFMKNFKLGLIDFGSVLFIDNAMMKKLSLFYKFLFNCQAKKLGKFFIEHAIVYNKQPPENISQARKQKIMEHIAKAFEKDNLLSGKKAINIYDMLDINNILIDIDAHLDINFMNVVLAVGPMSSIVSIIKRNDDNSLRRVFLGHIMNSVPESLKNYE